VICFKLVHKINNVFSPYFITVHIFILRLTWSLKK